MMDVVRLSRFRAWLADGGFDEPRRVVRETNGTILVSKFETGFAARLHDAVDRIPELFDAELVARRYREASAGVTRTEAWRTGLEALLAEVGPERDLDRDQLAQIQAGIDSVAALLDSVLWTSPLRGADWVVSEADRMAYADARARMDDEAGMFTRFYGEFEGARVENHCPGAQVARRLFEQAWKICTG